MLWASPLDGSHEFVAVATAEVVRLQPLPAVRSWLWAAAVTQSVHSIQWPARARLHPPPPPQPPVTSADGQKCAEMAES